MTIILYHDKATITYYLQSCHTLSLPANESVMAPVEPNVDYYAVLEISNFATAEDVIKSYRRLAKIRHPDKNLSNDSTAIFQLVSLLHLPDGLRQNKGQRLTLFSEAPERL